MLASPPRRRIRFSLGGVLYVKAAAVHVGYALVAVRPGPDDTWVSGDRLAELETLPVAPDERGQGIGSRLLDAVAKELARLGIGDLFIAALVGNAAAIPSVRTPRSAPGHDLPSPLRRRRPAGLTG
jgi:GNAT superfamily N-acetyltransferase